MFWSLILWLGVVYGVALAVSELKFGLRAVSSSDGYTRRMYRPKNVRRLLVTVVIIGASLWLLWPDLLGFVAKNWVFLVTGLVAYLLLGVIYVYLYREPLAVARYLEGMSELLENEIKSTNQLEGFDPEDFKARFKARNRLEVNNLSWLTAATLLWLPDLAYRSLFRFWWDMVKGFWTALAKNLQARFDQKWGQL